MLSDHVEFVDVERHHAPEPIADGRLRHIQPLRHL